MTAAWKKSFDPAPIAKRIEGSKVTQADGTYRLKGMGLVTDGIYVAVQDGIRFSDQLHPIYYGTVASKAVHNACRNGKVTPSSLIAQVNREQKAILSKPPRRFTVVSSFSLQSPVPSQRRISSTTLSFGNNLPRPLARSYRQLDPHVREMRDRPEYRRYQFVRIGIDARSPLEAGAMALHAADLLRAIWNLRINQKKGWRLSSRMQRVNTILFGPTHTIHDYSGTNMRGDYYYEEWHHDPPKAFAQKQHWTLVEDYERDVRRALTRHRYREIVENWLRRYTRALDDTDYSRVILQLWSLLESLTDTQQQRYDQTIHRAAFIDEDDEYARIVLDQIRHWRNDIVHKNESPDMSSGECRMFQLKVYVEHLLVLHIFNPFGLDSPREVGNMLDLPTCKATLRRRIRLINCAMKFRSND